MFRLTQRQLRLPFLRPSGISVAALLLAAVPLSWLLANHYQPWPSAWQDGLSLALLAGGLTFASAAVKVPALWLGVVGLAAASVLGQLAFGVIWFHGDAWMALLYLGAFALALGAGSWLVPAKPSGDHAALSAALTGIVLAAAISTGIALAQLTGNQGLGIFGADLRPGARPFGNFGQPNHLSTAAFLGLCALAGLFELRRVGHFCLALTATLLVIGMIASGSRTAWLQMAMVLLLMAWWRGRFERRIGLAGCFTGIMLFGLLSLAWPSLTEVFMVSGSRPLGDQVQAGVRLPLWLAMLEAIGREPVWGYGWQQMVLAQLEVAVDRPPLLRHFEHSHNLILDLLIWAGVPVGIGLIGGIAWAIQRLIRGTHQGVGAWLLMAALGVLTHAMVEFPLEHAYFLVPVGLLLGAASGLTAERSLLVPRSAVRAAGGVLAVVLSVTAFDYIRAEQAYRMLRLESARVGTAGIESAAPDLLVLDQLAAFQRFARQESRPGMTASEIDFSRRVSQRFAYPPAMFRHALTLGLNGDAAGAQLTLERLCHVHAPARCDEAIAGWQTLQGQHPELGAVTTPRRWAQQ